MKLPSKLRSYEKSVFPLLVKILNELKKSNYTFRQLRRLDSLKNINIDDFVEALDCLYFLNKIDVLDGGVLTYVENVNLW